MKKKIAKKPSYIENNTNYIIIVVAILIFAVFISSKYILKKEGPMTTSSTTTSVLTTTSTTTVPTIQTCGNFTWNIDQKRYFDLSGDYRILVIDLSAEYIGTETKNYGWVGAYKFKLLDDSGSYYNPQQAYLKCDLSDKFEIGTVNAGKQMSGCLEFRIPDAKEAIKLEFYDYVINKMCTIDLP
jgi:hypothetical protein